jgi:2-methylisocitrate lyase-like PEP mutase family enzyme
MVRATDFYLYLPQTPMTTTQDRRRHFKALLNENRTLIAPGAYDAFSAMLVQKAGFELVYVGSYGAAASMGLPDVGLLTMNELVACVKSVADAINIPVFADAENGFHNTANIWRTVRTYEETGVCAIHIDDHESGKHSNLAKRILPHDEMVQRIRAALEARQDPDFTIIARTDVAWASGKVDDAVKRMAAFADAGADVVLATGVTAAQLATVREHIAAKVILVNTPPETVAQESAAGANVVIYHSFCLYAASRGVTAALQKFRRSMDLAHLSDQMDSAEEVEALLDYTGFNARGARYGMV